MVTVPQRSFLGGIVSESRAPTRGNDPKVAAGLKDCRNAVVCRSDAIVNRMGSIFVRELADADAYTRSFGVTYGPGDVVDLIIGPSWLRLFLDLGIALTGTVDPWADATDYEVGDVVSQSGGWYYCCADHTSSAGTNEPTTSGQDEQHWHPLTAEGSSAILEIPTPWASEDLEELVVTPAGDRITVTHRSYPPHEIIRWTSTKWTCLPAAFRPSIQRPVAFTASGGSGTNTVKYRVTAIKKDTGEESAVALSGTGGGSGSVDGSVLSDPSNDVAIDATAHGLSDGDRIGFTSVSPASADIANQNAKIALLERDWVITKVTNDRFTLNDSAGVLTWPAIADPATWPDVDVVFRPIEVTVTADLPTPASAPSWISLTWTPPGDDYEEFAVYRAFGNSTASTAVDFGFIGRTKLITFLDYGQSEGDETLPPPSYRLPFGHETFPAATTYWNQRQVWAGSISRPNRVLMSVAGDFRNFRVSFPIQDSDSIDLDLVQLRAQAIVGVDELGGDLVIRTSGPLIVLRAIGGLAAPGNLETVVAHSEGSARRPAIMAKDSLIYLHRERTKVLMARFPQEQAGVGRPFVRDLTEYAPELFAGYTIESLAWCETPEPLLLAVRSDGVLLACTFDPLVDLWAWHRHDTGGTAAAIQSVAVLGEDGQDLPYLLVTRTIDSTVTWHLERLAPRTTGHAGDDPNASSRFLDSLITFQAAEDTSGTVLTLTSADMWTSGGEATLESSAALFVAGDVGKSYRLFDSADDYVDVIVQSYANDQAVTVVLAGDTPATLQAIAADAWLKKLQDLSDLDHLEGEQVYALADGVVKGPFTVASGAIDLGNATIAVPNPILCHVGLAIASRVELLTPDFVGGKSSTLTYMKTISEPGLLVAHTRGVKVGTSEAHLAPVTEPGAASTSTDPLTGAYVRSIAPRTERLPRLIIAQDQPLPFELHAVEYEVEVGDR